jgi:hypothetical protein
MKKADQLVDALLDSDDLDPKAHVLSPEFEKTPLHVSMQGVEGAVRRSGEDYGDQWEVQYKDWLFVVSFYEDGSQIWSVHYKTRPYSWDSTQGYSWSAGDTEKLPAGIDPKVYLARLKKMADDWPSSRIYSLRHIPRMPPADGPASRSRSGSY